jgi:hypothetical protein
MGDTPEIKKSETKGFLKLQQKQGGVKPGSLKNGDQLILDTIQYIYHLTVLDTLKGRRYILDTASPICDGSVVIIHIEAHFTKLKFNMENWLGKDMRPIFKFTNGTSVMVGDIKGMSVIGQNLNGETYKYNFWEN